MTITMYQADRNYVTPANDASLFSALAGETDGVLERGDAFNLSTNGLQITVGTGQAIVRGRLVEIVTAENITVPANTSGKLAITVDLTKQNLTSGTVSNASYAVDVQQVYLSAVMGSLVQEDVNNGGFIYQMPIANFNSTATTVTVTKTIPRLSDIDRKLYTTSPSFPSNYKTYSANGSDPVTINRIGNVVTMSGAATNVWKVPKTKDNKGYNREVMFRIPNGFRPLQDIRILQQGSLDGMYLMEVQTNGEVYCSRYRRHDDVIDIPVGAWLITSATYIAKIN